MDNRVDLYQPIVSVNANPPPLVLRVLAQNYNSIAGGVPETTHRPESYVLLSALPKELQERVRTAVQALITGM